MPTKNSPSNRGSCEAIARLQASGSSRDVGAAAAAMGSAVQAPALPGSASTEGTPGLAGAARIGFSGRYAGTAGCGLPDSDVESAGRSPLGSRSESGGCPDAERSIMLSERVRYPRVEDVMGERGTHRPAPGRARIAILAL